MLFSDRSIWTMVHGIVLGGGALLMISSALFFLVAMWPSPRGTAATERQSRLFAWLVVSTAVVLWLTVLIGTYVTFPPYRAAPPEGATELAQYPRSFLLANSDTAWLHRFAMESKEHMPWIAAMLATAVAFMSVRYGLFLFTDAQLHRMATAFLGISLGLVAFVSVMGVFINKVAPLE